MEGEEEKEQGEEEMEEDEDRTPSLRLGGGDEEEDGGDEEEAASRDPNATTADEPGAAPEAPVANVSDPNEDAAGSPDDPSAAAAPPSQPPDEADDSNKKKKGVKRKQNGDGETVKKTKKKTNVWCKSTTRKSTKKGSGRAQAKAVENENSIFLTPVMPRVEDGPDLPVVLSKFHKAEKVELSPDQLTASSCKGYRMVRATRGVVEGAWYFEIHVEHLGSTGHARLGWCTQKGDVQAPVGYDAHGYAYRDLEGSKVHAALREPYGEPYVEGDTIGFYINLPNGAADAPKPPEIVSFKGAPYTPDVKDEPLKPLPGSEIALFKNGVYQGTAYKDIYAGRYYPAASMYTMPNEPSCSVRFNFGPDFACFPSDFHGLTPPEPMSKAPYAEELVVGAQAAGLQNGQASTSNPPKLQETEVVTNGTPKGEMKKGKGKPPKHSLKKGTLSKNKGGNGKQAPGLELAVEVPIESASMVSHRIASSLAATSTK